VGNDKKEPGVRKSLLLLFGRLLITLLFLYVGWVQIYRVMMRDWALWSKLEYDSMWRKDGHVSFVASLLDSESIPTSLINFCMVYTWCAGSESDQSHPAHEALLSKVVMTCF